MKKLKASRPGNISIRLKFMFEGMDLQWDLDQLEKLRIHIVTWLDWFMVYYVGESEDNMPFVMISTIGITCTSI